MYIVNDIENLVLINRLNLLEILIREGMNFVISDIRVSDFSAMYNHNIEILKKAGVEITETDIEFYAFKNNNLSMLRELSDGDISTVYIAKQLNNCLITSNSSIKRVCESLNIEVKNIETLLLDFFNDIELINTYKEMRVA